MDIFRELLQLVSRSQYHSDAAGTLLDVQQVHSGIPDSAYHQKPVDFPAGSCAADDVYRRYAAGAAPAEPADRGTAGSETNEAASGFAAGPVFAGSCGGYRILPILLRRKITRPGNGIPVSLCKITVEIQGFVW